MGSRRPIYCLLRKICRSKFFEALILDFKELEDLWICRRQIHKKLSALPYGPYRGRPFR